MGLKEIIINLLLAPICLVVLVVLAIGAFRLIPNQPLFYGVIFGFIVFGTLAALVGFFRLLTTLLKYPTSKIRVIEKSLSKQSKEKEQNKAKILTLFDERGQIKNHDVQELLGVSDATVTRYLDELEEEGKVTQHGDRKSAYYTKQ